MNSHTISRDKIIIKEDRQRQEFDPEKANELAESVYNKGLMHAPVLRPPHAEENFPADHLVLVAGECRIRALDLNWFLNRIPTYNGIPITKDAVPYSLLKDLTPLQAEEAELDENLHRTDLTWQERSTAMAKLHSLRSRQAMADGRVHTIADTAMETRGRSDGSYQDAVRKEIIVAKHLNNPEVQKAKTTEEAFKILKKQEETRKNIEHAAVVGKTFNSSMHTVLNVDCLQWMSEANPEQFDVILTDPPYGMGADEFGDGAGKLVNSEHHYKDDYEHWRQLMEQWCVLSYRVAKQQAHAYVFCDQDNFHELKQMMQDAGWYVFRTMLIAHKPNSGRVPLPDRGPRRQYETILYAIKGKKLTNMIASDVISTVQDANLTHGAQKPTALYEDLLKRSIRAGDSVLDSFCGSGTIFAAAHNLKVKATGLELNPEYFSISLKRLKSVENQGAPMDADALTAELNSMMGKK